MAMKASGSRDARTRSTRSRRYSGLSCSGSPSANNDASAARLPCAAALRRSASTRAAPSLSPGTNPPQRCATRSRA
ncbi:hypothetical protein G6F23_016029 [Rhizopus arrhizus]|nr:hypothetical protein G6F23_016029 [Rhizopus arrhizus]